MNVQPDSPAKRVMVSDVLPLEQAASGLGRLATGGAGGKLVVTI
ncbi:hypothetical protein [Deinococcus hohokamensis]|uniref:Uncharacterized protein n=1 Tax=Deinococcus hohokamensis TaxID=309883 RepID=A0ABV9I704_9DEIO